MYLHSTSSMKVQQYSTSTDSIEAKKERGRNTSKLHGLHTHLVKPSGVI